MCVQKYFSFFSIFLVSLFLYNCGGGGGGGVGGGNSINYNSGPSSSGGTFLDSGTSVTYNSTTASNHQAYDQYENIARANSGQNNYDLINLHKAYGYGYSGDGQLIAILDSNFDTNHHTYTGKTVTTHHTLEADTTSDYHGNTVASIAAGYLDTSYSGTVATHGVAYDADLHLADYTKKGTVSGHGSADYYPHAWAFALADARADDAVVQNNSWGVNEQYNSSTSYSASSLATMWTNAGLSATSGSVNSYIDGLNNFQSDSGVIVYALSNTSSFGDADVQAALPEIFSQLKEAWITAVNVDITGSSGSESYSRKSAPCGSTAEYCIGADGYNINGAAYYTSSSFYVTGGTSGTSFVAPQISGAVAIMAEAFPSQTPEQWTDRLLASADNSFFTASGNVEFANGITHAYNTEFGHGILDIEAALKPITSSRMQESILIGDNFETATVHNLNKSHFSNNLIFGDSISNSFRGKKSYFYDALYGAFEYDFDIHLINEKPKKINILENSFDQKKYKTFSNQDEITKRILNFSFVSDEDNYLLPEEGVSYTVSNNNYNLNGSYNYPLDLSLGFFSPEEINFFKNNENIFIPYLKNRDNTYNISSNIFNNKRTNIGLGYVQTEEGSLLDKKGYVLSYSNAEKGNAILGGITTEEEGFLDNSFNGAFTLAEDNNPTNFIAFKQNSKLGKNKLMFVSSYGSTNVSNSSNSLISNIDNVNTTSFSVNLSRNELFNKKDKITFSISQPQRVESGKMKYLVPKLNDKNGTLNYSEFETNLQPSGRQINYLLNYDVVLIDNFKLSFQGKLIDDYSHIAKDGLDTFIMTSIKYKF